MASPGSPRAPNRKLYASPYSLQGILVAHEVLTPSREGRPPFSGPGSNARDLRWCRRDRHQSSTSHPPVQPCARCGGRGRRRAADQALGQPASQGWARNVPRGGGWSRRPGWPPPPLTIQPVRLGKDRPPEIFTVRCAGHGEPRVVRPRAARAWGREGTRLDRVGWVGGLVQGRASSFGGGRNISIYIIIFIISIWK